MPRRLSPRSTSPLRLDTLPSRQTRSCLLPLVAAALCVVQLSADPALAEYQGVTWGATTTLDLGISASSDPQPAVVYGAGLWHVVYERNGGIEYISGVDGSWSSPYPLVPAGSGASHPDIGRAGPSLLTIVWEAPGRGGRTEVQASFGDGTSWSEPERISGIGTSSQRPSVAGRSSLYAVVAWEDSTPEGWRTRARVYRNGWSDTEALGTGTAEARDPVVSATLDAEVFVAWSDFRDGDADIYVRPWWPSGGWQDEIPYILTSFDCRHPEMTSSWNYDYYNRFLLVLCEATGVNGAPEVYHRSWCSDPNGDWLSPDDGIPSYGASVSSFNSPISTCNSLGSSFAVLLYGWVEGEGGTGVTLSRRSDCRLDAVHDLPVSNPLATAIGAESGDVVQLWTENSDGTIQLRAREGSTPPCSIQRVDALTPALVGPAGWPPTRFRAYNNCTGVGIPDLPIEFILFDDPAIVLAADQSPWVSGETDDDGYAEFHIRGGGCLWQTVPVGPWEWCWADLEGIRSPDIDADCVVTESDRLYIEQRLGSYDFCADLDGSGLVDAGDLAVVDATMGDSCEDTSGIDAPVGSGPRLQLTVAPNPAQDQTILRIVQPNDGTGITAVRVLDAGGRQVKTIRVSSAGGEGRILWDLSDDHGQRLPSGLYFAVGTTRSGECRTPFLIVR